MKTCVSCTMFGVIRTKTTAIYEKLGASIANPVPLLVFDGVFQLLIAVILSAQTTDAQVNRVTPKLFRQFPTPPSLAGASQDAVEEIVHSTGFYRTKAKNIRMAARVVVERFNGNVPETMKELLSIPGVGRKSANVVLGGWYGRPAIIVDTHFSRVVRRLGLTTAVDPSRIENDLRLIVPEEIQYAFSMLINHHGRLTCAARKPQCGSCVLRVLCPREGLPGRPST